ncbi:SGNH/GDSL hydrolase family protein [Mycobacterium sp. C31M]
MARLPKPGGDHGNWGDVLNDYLSQSLKPDGTLKDNAVTSNVLAPNSITNSAIADSAVNATSIADGSVTEALLHSDVQTKLNQAAPTWTTLSGKPAVVAAGVGAAEARAAIGAVTISDVSAGYVVQGPNPAGFVSKCAIGVNAVVGIAGDSTADKPYEYLAMGLAAFVKQFPRMNADYYQWDGTSTYGTVVPILTGITSRTVVMRDDFNRTAADIVGSAPNVGGSTWSQTGTGDGDWLLDGSALVATADVTSGYVLNTVGTGDGELVTRATLQNLDAPRFYIKWVNSSNYIRLVLETNSSGQVRLSLGKCIAGTLSALGTASEYFYNNTGVTTYDVTCRIVGTRVTASLNGQMVGGALTASDVSALSGGNQVGLSGTNRGSTSIDFIEWATVTAAPTPSTVTIYNASKSGSVLTYQEGLIGTLFPSGITFDTVIINSGHNYSAASSGDYLTAIDSFIASLRTVQPSTAIVIASQNPRLAPATYVTEHANRIVALPTYAARRSYGYIPSYESFATLMALSSAYIQSDGIHPTGAIDGGAGLQSLATLTYLNRQAGFES